MQAFRSVAPVAELMEADDLGVPRVLGKGWGRRERPGKDGNRKSS
jgi:hypothetical protein